MSQWQAADIPQRLTRRYCAARLLALGPLTLHDFRLITGWTEQESRQMLDELLHAKVITYRNGVNQQAIAREYVLLEN